jgi:hypothetical protein
MNILAIGTGAIYFFFQLFRTSEVLAPTSHFGPMPGVIEPFFQIISDEATQILLHNGNNDMFCTSGRFLCDQLRSRLNTDALGGRADEYPNCRVFADFLPEPGCVLNSPVTTAPDPWGDLRDAESFASFAHFISHVQNLVNQSEDRPSDDAIRHKLYFVVARDMLDHTGKVFIFLFLSMLHSLGLIQTRDVLRGTAYLFRCAQ